MKNTFRLIGVLAGAITLITGSATVATAHRNDGGGYGYQQVRGGVPEEAGHFRVASPDLRGRFPADDLAAGFGCAGSNAQPRLTWSGVPAGARSLAVTMFDVDAPTGSGFWHWLEWDVPAGTRTLTSAVPAGAVSGTNDAGGTGYLGPCPPAGDIAHRYRITVYALDVTTLALPADTPAAVTTFTMSSHVLATASMTATARR